MITIKIHDIETGEVIEREMTNKELADWQADQTKIATQLEIQKKEAEAKEAARQSLLAKLGLTPDDLKALGL